MKKFLAILSSLIVIIIIALVAFIKFYVTPERVKEFIVPTAEKSLNRTVEIGEISINIFKGIGLKDFAIKEADGKTDFIKCKDFVLKFKLLPLLSKNLIIDELKVVSPEIHILRAKDGTYNFEDIGKKELPVEDSAVKKETKSGESEGLPISLLVSKVIIESAGFSLTDLSNELPDIKSHIDIDLGIESLDGSELSTVGSIDLKLDELVLKGTSQKKVKDIIVALKYAVKLNLETYDINIEKADLKLQELSVSLTGSIKDLKASPNLDIALSSTGINTAEALKLASSFTDLKGIKLSGTLVPDIKVKGRPDKIDSLKTDVSLQMNNITFKYDKISSSIDGNMKFKTNADNINIEKADLKVQGIPVSLTGSIKKLKASPYLDVAISLPDANIADLQALAAPFADMKDLKLSGRLSVNAKVKGTPEKPETLKTSGNIKMKKVGILYEEINALLNGSIKFSDKKMNINMMSSVGKNNIAIKGSIRNYLKNQVITLDIYSKKLFLDELIPAGEKEKTGKASQPSGKKKQGPIKAAKEAKPLDLKLTASGEVKIDSAIYKGLNMTNFIMKYSFKNNKLNISKMTAKAGKGKIDLNTLVDLSKPGYKYKLSSSIDSLHADEVVNAMFPKAKDTVFGVLSFNLKLNGAGTLPENIKKNLTADSDFKIKDGKIKNTKLAANLSRLLSLSELETIHIQQAEGKVKIRKSVARLDSIFTSGDFSMDPSGNIGLDETLALAFDLKLSPGLTDKAARSSSIARFIRNEEGWGIIPLKVSGTFSNPTYTVDIEKASKRAIKNEANKFLDKLLNKKQQTAPKPDKTQEPAEQDPLKLLEKPIQDLLKGLF